MLGVFRGEVRVIPEQDPGLSQGAQHLYKGYGDVWTSLVAQMVKNPPAMWETWVEKILEKGMATHSSILA